MMVTSVLKYIPISIKGVFSKRDRNCNTNVPDRGHLNAISDTRHSTQQRGRHPLIFTTQSHNLAIIDLNMFLLYIGYSIDIHTLNLLQEGVYIGGKQSRTSFCEHTKQV